MPRENYAVYTSESKYRYFDDMSLVSPSIVQVDTDMKIFETVITEYLYPRLQKRLQTVLEHSGGRPTTRII